MEISEEPRTDSEAGKFESIESIQKELVDIRRSEVFRKLKTYYSRQSVFDLIGVSRKEDTHSRLLGWLFDPEGTHNLGTLPLRHLLETVAVVISKSSQRVPGSLLPADFLNQIIADSYTISSASLTLEKPVTGSREGRIDVFIEGVIKSRPKRGDRTDRNQDGTYTFRVVIENKVEASEHHNQTKNYEQWLARTRTEETVDLPLFLSPLPTLDLDNLEEPECASRAFLQINYQYLVDYVITPCLQEDLGPQARWILEEYARTLSYPSSADIGNATVMALGDQERKLLSDFWNEHSALLRTMMSAIGQDPEQDEDVRELARKFADVSSKDHSDVQILVNGEAVRSFPYKADVGHELVRVLQDHDLLTGETFDALRTDQTTGRPLLKTMNEMKGDDVERRYRTKDDQKIVHEGETYYASSQWTAKRVVDINDVLSDVFGSATRVTVHLIDEK